MTRPHDSSSARSSLSAARNATTATGSVNSEPLLPDFDLPRKEDPDAKQQLSSSWNSVESIPLASEEPDGEAEFSSSSKNLYGKQNVSEDAIQREVIETKRSWFRTFVGFLGPGCLIAVGYMDPGNWATDLSGGSQFEYKLLFAVLLSNIMAVLLQSLAVRAGVVTGRDLAQLCRRHFPQYATIPLYILAEVAIAACDLAEVIGAAIALNLLFGLPLPWGVAVTALDVLVVLMGFSAKRLRYFELFIFVLIAIIGLCFCVLLAKVSPVWGDVFFGYLPSSVVFTNGRALYLFIGIVGATVMPHNLYLHSNLVLYRYRPYDYTPIPGTAANIGDVQEQETEFKGNPDAPRGIEHERLIPSTIRFAQIDSIVALTYALFVNSAILIVAGAAFSDGNAEIGSIRDGYDYLSSQLGPAAGVVFAIALLCSGQSSTITATLAGQIVMGGFLGDRFIVRPWVRRIVARSIAIIPAMITAILLGEKGIDQLLIISQVVLSLQLPFAVWPLVWFTSKRAYMTVDFHSPGDPPTQVTSKNFANPIWETVLAVTAATIITGLNFTLLIQFFVPDMFETG